MHEWGTFLGMNGSDGTSLDGMYHEEHALPGFVHGRARDQLRMPMMLLKGETPVIYFYTPRPVRVRVGVDFPQGIWTHWYPQAALVNPPLAQQAQSPDQPAGRPDLLVRRGDAAVARAGRGAGSAGEGGRRRSRTAGDQRRRLVELRSRRRRGVRQDDGCDATAGARRVRAVPVLSRPGAGAAADAGRCRRRRDARRSRATRAGRRGPPHLRAQGRGWPRRLRLPPRAGAAASRPPA